jgi:DNA-binding LacI/PurR family transcriptional regulator
VSASIRDVARAAGVSPSTVSRALSGSDLVKEATRERVRTTAERLGYRPSRVARGLVMGRTGNLGIIVPDLSNPFFASVAKGVQLRARESDYALFVADTNEEVAAEADLVRALAKQVDGIILCSPRMSDAEIDDVAVESTVVLMNRQSGGHPSVTVGNEDGMSQALAHLVALGHRRVAYVGGPRTSYSNTQRQRGLQVAAATFGADLVEVGHFVPDFDGGIAAADLVVASGATAVIAYNDIVALGLLARLAARGLAVPGALSVIGCDDIAMASMSRPALTTVAIPKDQAGRAAVALLLSLLDNPERSVSVQRELPTQLMVRGTTEAPHS